MSDEQILISNNNNEEEKETVNEEVYADVIEQFPSYEGHYQHGRYHGKGKLRLSKILHYEGTFADGLFHGEGRFYVEGGYFEGYWSRGKLQNGGFIFADGLPFKMGLITETQLESQLQDWEYCSDRDPRFFSEIRDGIAHGDQLRDETAHDHAHALPMGCYDAIEGYYHPQKHAIFAYGSDEMIRVPEAQEIEWLMNVGRVGKGEQMSYA